ncbi:MAG: ParB N-terminal domain-containing protein [Alphaproteobacteria bacterium]|nr:ParB N-terminal domain-containing protein [Alphaproteobacteria bacterium]
MHDTAIAADGRLGESSEELWLLGQPDLGYFLKFVRDRVVGGTDLSPRTLADEWRRANDYYYELEESEAGIADQVECQELDRSLLPLAEQVIAAPWFRRAFDTLPITFAMVELDHLVVFQPNVTREFVDELKARLGPDPDQKSLFRFCIPLERPEPAVKVQRLGSRCYQVSSESADFRFLEAAIFQPDQITDYQAHGRIGAVIGAVVGFGSNFLNVIRDEGKRILLNNGYHRAVALRELGITHAPCIIQEVTRRDELAVAAGSTVNRTPFFYFGKKRPPLLKDFFDPKIRKVLPVRRMRRIVEIKIEVRKFDVFE